MRWSLFILLGLMTAPAQAQESPLHAEFRLEGEHISENCGALSLNTFGGCAQEFFTDHPLHIAAGSVAPQNGFGSGLAFISHHSSKNWRESFNVDAVVAPNLSWRAGVYVKFIHTPVVKITIVRQTAGKPPRSRLAVYPHTIFGVYAQSISLQKVEFFGLGNTSRQSGRTFFGERETIIGGNVIKPVTVFAPGLNLSLVGEINGRFVDFRGNHGGSSPSIEQLYNESAAPGLAQQPGFAQFAEGLRAKPILFGDHLQFDYLLNFQQFLAVSNSRYSFLRWTVDLNHEFPLYRNQPSSKPKDTNGPDECATSVTAEQCPPVSISRNHSGTAAVRFLLSESVTSASRVVPFYFQPTLGGSDLNGNPSLSSYQDYRFRGPNLLLLHESLEHSVWGPLGISFQADQGKVALTHGDIEFAHLKHSFATGLTLRAGGFPQVFLLYAWGGNEGHHVIGSANASVLGGSPRPSLF